MLQPRLLRPAGLRLIPRLARRQYASVVEDAPSTVTVDGIQFTMPSKPTRSTAESKKVKESSQLMRKWVPRTPGLRHRREPVNDHLYQGDPWSPLVWRKRGHGKGGRNNSGQITVRHRGGGQDIHIRTVDFTRSAPGKHRVERIEQDPNRSGHIALLTNLATYEKSYIVAAVGMRAGDIVESFRAGIPQDVIDDMGGKVDMGLLAAKTVKRGNCLPIRLIPPGTQVYCVGSSPLRPAVFCRSAGTYATVVGKESVPAGVDPKKYQFVIVKLQSGEIRKVGKNACATVGVVSNPLWQYRQLGKAGRARWENRRPTVRGMAMNACELPLSAILSSSLIRQRRSSPRRWTW